MNIARFIEELCILPNRASCSANEMKGAEYIYRNLRKHNMDVEFQEFRSQKRMTWELVTIILGFGLAIMFSFFNAISGFMIGLFSFLLFWGHFSLKFKPLSRLLSFSTSINVVGRLLNKSAKQRIILVAHHDTARSGPLWNPQKVKNFRLNFLINIFLLILVLVILGFKIIFPALLFLNYLLIPLVIFMLGQAVLLIFSGYRGALVQGASDNASGVAVVLDLAQRLTAKPLKNFEVWFVLTGSEEVGAIGIDNFMKTNQDKLLEKTNSFINFDNLGAGQVNFFTGEGMIFLKKFTGTLIDAARQVTRQEGFDDIKENQYRLAYTDALVTANHNFPTLLLLAQDENGLIPHWHWPTDTVENIDIAVPVKASAFALAIMQYMDEQA